MEERLDLLKNGMSNQGHVSGKLTFSSSQFTCSHPDFLRFFSSDFQFRRNEVAFYFVFSHSSQNMGSIWELPVYQFFCQMLSFTTKCHKNNQSLGFHRAGAVDGFSFFSSSCKQNCENCIWQEKMTDSPLGKMVWCKLEMLSEHFDCVCLVDMRKQMHPEFEETHFPPW